MEQDEKQEKPLLRLKKMLKLHGLVKVEPVEIELAIFNFSTGVCDRYRFLLHYVLKIPYGSSAAENDYPNHVVNCYGLIYFKGDSVGHKHWYKLTYTDDEELEKVILSVKNGLAIPSNLVYDTLKCY